MSVNGARNATGLFIQRLFLTPIPLGLASINNQGLFAIQMSKDIVGIDIPFVIKQPDKFCGLGDNGLIAALNG